VTAAGPSHLLQALYLLAWLAPLGLASGPLLCWGHQQLLQGSTVLLQQPDLLQLMSA
jgi:hypothetical protein